MELFTFTNQLAVQTGKLLLEHFKPSGIDASLKSDRTVVTNADLAADKFIHEVIHKTFPFDGILSEEQNTIYPIDSERVWIIDPLDGTTNFSLGLQYWGVSLCLLVYGQPEVAAIYFPLVNEVYTAQRGVGAFLNGIPLEITTPDNNRPYSFFACCSRTHRRYKVKVLYKTRMFGCATYSFCAVARGSAILAFEATPKIWDISACYLVVEEAGGSMQTLDGADPFPIIPGQDYNQISFPTLSGASSELINIGLEQIIPI